jgi:6-pyruvoyltetrahydropterin/6-carboxytetrahydropterin synthase
MYHVTKHYPHSLGLSACFRQPRAESHCHFLHGYALAFTFEFEAETLDKNNWVIDFGGLKPLKQFLVDMFDHKTMIAENDIDAIQQLTTIEGRRICDYTLLPRVGMEAFAYYAFQHALAVLDDMGVRPRVRLAKVTVAEHEGNSASYSEPL